MQYPTLNTILLSRLTCNLKELKITHVSFNKVNNGTKKATNHIKTKKTEATDVASKPISSCQPATAQDKHQACHVTLAHGEDQTCDKAKHVSSSLHKSRHKASNGLRGD
jgi:hypothetical protein